MAVSALTSGAGPRLARVRLIRPELVDEVAKNYSTLATMFDPVCLELCRIRIGQILDATEQPGSPKGLVSPDRIEQLKDWRSSKAFNDRERACLEFAEQFLYSANSITDEQVEELKRHFAPEEIWVLTNAVAVTERFGRLAAYLETADAKVGK